MTTPIKWDTFTDRGNVLGSELDGLTNNTTSATGSHTADVNDVNLDTLGFFELDVTFDVAPDATGAVEVYELISLDGTNYQTNLEPIAEFMVDAVTTAQRIPFGPFPLRPFKTKYKAKNQAGQDFHSTGNTLKLYTGNLAQ